MNNKSISLIVSRLHQVSKVYQSHGNSYIALKEIDFSASRGELSLLLGPSGSGKTTMLTILAGFTKPTEGKVVLFEKDISSYSSKELQKLRANRIGFVFQTFLLIDSLNVFENILLVLKFSSKSDFRNKQKTLDAMEMVRIAHLAKKHPSELSNGEKQRVAIARAFANDADFLIADEPTASLESKQGEEIISLLHSYASEFNKCVVVASHDLRLKSFADKIIHMENGEISRIDSSSN